MYDHDEEALFAMLLRIELPAEQLPMLRQAMIEIGKLKRLSIRVWSAEARAGKVELAKVDVDRMKELRRNGLRARRRRTVG
jgi:formyltetrahydrofolate deformylase